MGQDKNQPVLQAADEPKEGTLLPVDELKKAGFMLCSRSQSRSKTCTVATRHNIVTVAAQVSKYLQHTLTKFGASATAVANAEDASSVRDVRAMYKHCSARSRPLLFEIHVAHH